MSLTGLMNNCAICLLHFHSDKLCKFLFKAHIVILLYKSTVLKYQNLTKSPMLLHVCTLCLLCWMNRCFVDQCCSYMIHPVNCYCIHTIVCFSVILSWLLLFFFVVIAFWHNSLVEVVKSNSQLSPNNTASYMYTLWMMV